jgi:hypothetical protein
MNNNQTISYVGDLMITAVLAPHETIELRETLNSEIVAVKKLQVTMPIVKDSELKSFMAKCLENKKIKIETIQSFIQRQQ